MNICCSYLFVYLNAIKRTGCFVYLLGILQRTYVIHMELIRLVICCILSVLVVKAIGTVIQSGYPENCCSCLHFAGNENFLLVLAAINFGVSFVASMLMKPQLNTILN